jgi:hypothetical protein
MSELEKVLIFLPEKYRPIASALIVASPFITRAIYALMQGGGIRGIIYGIWLGTNQPKAKPDEIKTP